MAAINGQTMCGIGCNGALAQPANQDLMAAQANANHHLQLANQHWWSPITEVVHAIVHPIEIIVIILVTLLTIYMFPKIAIWVGRRLLKVVMKTMAKSAKRLYKNVTRR